MWEQLMDAEFFGMKGYLWAYLAMMVGIWVSCIALIFWSIRTKQFSEEAKFRIFELDEK